MRKYFAIKMIVLCLATLACLASCCCDDWVCGFYECYCECYRSEVCVCGYDRYGEYCECRPRYYGSHYYLEDDEHNMSLPPPDQSLDPGVRFYKNDEIKERMEE